MALITIGQTARRNAWAVWLVKTPADIVVPGVFCWLGQLVFAH
ncbi:hypothetical protein [Secundilactobacillus pentosiphilus]|nr:hypothetical protein [Secundilactobacillus pentosiphilus]